LFALVWIISFEQIRVEGKDITIFHTTTYLFLNVIILYIYSVYQIWIIWKMIATIFVIFFYYNCTGTVYLYSVLLETEVFLIYCIQYMYFIFCVLNQRYFRCLLSSSVILYNVNISGTILQHESFYLVTG